MDAINSSHAAELTEAAATTAHRQLSAYFQRFQSRLAPGNCRHIQTLSRCAQVGCASCLRAVAGLGWTGTRFNPMVAPSNCRRLRMRSRGAQEGLRERCAWGLAVRQVARRPEEVARLLPPGPTPVPTAGMSRPHSTAQVLSRAASGALPLAATSASGGAAAGAPSKGHGSGGSGSTGGNGASASAGAVLTVNDFLLQTGLDNLNLFKLVRLVSPSILFPLLPFVSCAA